MWPFDTDEGRIFISRKLFNQSDAIPGDSLLFIIQESIDESCDFNRDFIWAFNICLNSKPFAVSAFHRVNRLIYKIMCLLILMKGE